MSAERSVCKCVFVVMMPVTDNERCDLFVFVVMLDVDDTIRFVCRVCV